MIPTNRAQYITYKFKNPLTSKSGRFLHCWLPNTEQPLAADRSVTQLNG